MSNQQTILVADDDEMIVDALSYQLEREGYNVVIAYDGEQALSLARTEHPDMLLLDVMMPKRQGWDVCRELRTESTVPILMLTARGEEMDRVLGLEIGADDYIVKPFSFRELLARIRATLRRITYERSTTTESDLGLQTIGPLVIDQRRHTVTRENIELNLAQKEYALLITLLNAEGAVVERNELMDKVWGEDWIGDTRTLDVHVRWLRGKIEQDPGNPTLILTVRGVGYRLVTPDELK